MNMSVFRRRRIVVVSQLLYRLNPNSDPARMKAGRQNEVAYYFDGPLQCSLVSIKIFHYFEQ